MSKAADTATCASCGSEVSIDARFCSSCGRPVGTATAGERKVVTVVFADLAGFTSLAESRDPEAVKDLLDRCFACLVPVIVEHGGTVDKIIGDELMAVFGVPVSHENDPDRAVRSALDLILELHHFSPELVLRIGINTGEVLVGPLGPGGASTVTGDTVNTAHRLASVARPGEILVGERTWTASEGTIYYEERPPYELRGRQALEQARAAVGARGAAARRAPMQDGGALIGRSGELEQLVAESGRTIASPEASVVLITGEPGLGKTRLAVEFAASLWSGDHRHAVWTTCPAYGGGGLEPVAEIVRATLEIDGALPRSAQLAAVDAQVGPMARSIAVDGSMLRARLVQLLGLDEQPGRLFEPDPTTGRARVVDQLLAGAHQVLRAAAAKGPLLVVADDLQWADDAVLDFIEQIPARAGPAPMLVLALGRDELIERRSTFRSGHRGIVPIHLRSLGRSDSAALLAALIVQEDPRGAAVEVHLDTEQRILDAAGGNPLLLEQVVRYLLESGTLTRQAGRWQISDAFDGVGIPDGARSLIGARLDALPPHERLVIQHASVMGRRFWADGVQVLLGPGGADADSAIATLMGRGLIESVAHDSRPGDFAFRHVLTRDVAYATIPLGDRAVRHAAVARWLTDRFAEEVTGRLAGLLAYHYERTVLLSRELDHTAPGLAGAAFGALVRAGREAERREATRDAEAWYRRARVLGSADLHLTLEVMLSHGIALLNLRRLNEAMATLEELRHRALACQDDPQADALARRALGWLAAAARLSGDQDTARQLFEQAQLASRDVGDLLGEADAVRLAGWSELNAGRPRLALPRLRRAGDLERLAGAGDRAETLQALGWAEFSVGEIEAAQRHLWEAARRFAAAGDRGQVSWCFGILCFTFLETGRVSHATAVAGNLVKASRTDGDPWGEALCMVLLAACHSAAGKVNESEDLAREALRRFDEVSEPWGQVLAHLVLGGAARQRGALAEARTYLHRGLDTARRVIYVGEDARLLAELAAVEADAGDDDEATRRARAALALVRRGLGDQDSGLRSLIVLANLRVSAGDLDGAQLLLEEAVALRQDQAVTETWRQACARLATVLADRGELTSAETYLATADDGQGESAATVVAVALASAHLAHIHGRDADATALLEATLAASPTPDIALFDVLRAELDIVRSFGG